MDDLIDKIAKLDLGDKDFVDNFCRVGASSKESKAKQFFSHFDKNKDGFLDKVEFFHLIRALFTDKSITTKDAVFMFSTVDENQDGRIDLDEFMVSWRFWLSQVLDPVTALVVVDVQNDFISGSLALRNCPAGQEGEDVVPVINSMLQTVNFDAVLYTYDWHPENHISFFNNVGLRPLHPSSKVKKASEAVIMQPVVFDQAHGPAEQILWPAHCVQKSNGAALHPDLKVDSRGISVYKGTNPEVDSYSAFWDNNKLSQTDMLKQLTSRGVTDVYVCGLATDICVGFTTLHALEHGYRVTLVDDASRGVDLQNIDATKKKIVQEGGIVATSKEVLGLAVCKDRRVAHGRRACETFAKARKYRSQPDQADELLESAAALHMTVASPKS